MRKSISRIALILVLAFTCSAWADASVYVVHGIPGSDLGLAPELPVDISVNGDCAIQDFRFAEILGPIELPGGFYDIDISVSDTNNPCGNPAVISVGGLELTDGVDYSVVAHLDEMGDATASAFVNNVDPTGRGKARLIAHHTAAAPAVDVTVAREEDGTGPSLTIPDFVNGQQAEAEVRPGEWWVSIAPAGSGMPVFGPAAVELEPFTAYLVYAVGTVDTGTFTLLIQPVGGLKPMGGNKLYQQRLEVGRALLEVQFTNVAEVLPYYTEDIEYHDPIVDLYGIEQVTGFLYQLLGASPDLVTIIEDEILVGDIYSATWTMSGQFLGIPYEAKGISIFKFRRQSAMVYYQRDYYSEGDIMATIPGLDLAIEGFRTFYRCAVDPTFECPFGGPPSGSESGIGFEEPDNPQALLGRDNRLRSPEQLRRAQLAVGRQLVEINAENWTAVLPKLASNYEYHDPIVDIYGPDTMAEFLGRLFAGSSDLYTTVEDETLVGGVYMATWTMSGMFDGAEFSAPGMSIVKFVDGTLQSHYSRDYYTEGDIMLGVPELEEAVQGFRVYYRCAVDPTFECPL